NEKPELLVPSDLSFWSFYRNRQGMENKKTRNFWGGVDRIFGAKAFVNGQPRSEADQSLGKTRGAKNRPAFGSSARVHEEMNAVMARDCRCGTKIPCHDKLVRALADGRIQETDARANPRSRMSLWKPRSSHARTATYYII